MQISVIGAGYVGLATALCMAWKGKHKVILAENNQQRNAMLKLGIAPFYEPGLEDLLKQVLHSGNLHIVETPAEAAHTAIIFITVGTPQADDGAADLTTLNTVVQQLAPHLTDNTLVVLKSTVPVGTTDRVSNLLSTLTNKQVTVIANPEFLREGSAIQDFLLPDRIVVGTRNQRSADILAELHAPFFEKKEQFLVMDPCSAEILKSSANAILALRISFINEIANLCTVSGGDITAVTHALGLDPRISPHFLGAGLGYGGACFPKDIRALIASGHQYGIDLKMCEATDLVNDNQPLVLIPMLQQRFPQGLDKLTLAIWGAAFKPGTGDARNSPALVLAQYLLNAGTNIHIHDPAALESAKQYLHAGNAQLKFFDQALSALENADALILATDWSDYRDIPLSIIASQLPGKTVFDGRVFWDPQSVRDAGLSYYGIGRPHV